MSPCSANPCLNDGSCTVDVNGKAVCACNGEWSGFYCSGLFYIVMYKQTRSRRNIHCVPIICVIKNKIFSAFVTFIQLMTYCEFDT